MSDAPEQPSRIPRSVAWLAPVAVVTTYLAYAAISAVIEKSGAPAVPLDDSYIHFQYARSIAELHPFCYTPGAAPTPGATSLLWPALIAPFYALGFHGDRIVWIAWFLGFVSLGGLTIETARLARGLVGPTTAVAAGALCLSFGGYTWFAASGMEVVPFAWLLTRTTRRAAEWLEAHGRGGFEKSGVPPGSPDARGAARRGATRLVSRHAPSYRELLWLAALCPLARPEGIIGPLFVGVALVVAPRKSKRRFALPVLAAPCLPSLTTLLFTGQAVASTAYAKWLPLNPYQGGGRLYSSVASHVVTFFGTLLDGRLWTSAFLPEGFRSVFILGLLALPLAGKTSGRHWRALFTLGFALAILIPTTYETFLVNRLRYIWPFAPAWFVGLAALSELAGKAVERALSRVSLELPHVPLVFAGSLVGLLASRIGPSVDDLASSCEAITNQQVSLGKWAAEALPAGARLGINDTGAIAYFSGHPTFDIVGLTTAGEARYWSAGFGSRFEHYEKLPRTALPDYFIVYKEWFGMESLLGDVLETRIVHHTILGGSTMTAFTARYDVLGTGEHPSDPRFADKKPLDILDVADLEDEKSHGYVLGDTTDLEDVVVADLHHADGARLSRQRDSFRLRVSGGGVLFARWGAEADTAVTIRLNDVIVADADIPASGWHEVAIPLPATASGEARVTVEANGGRFASLHYWSYE